MLIFFREGADQIAVRFANGQTYGAKLVAVDRQADLAALAIANPLALPVDLSFTIDQAATFHACGFGPWGVYRCALGRKVGLATVVGQMSLMLSGGVRSGDSGGAVCDERGEHSFDPLCFPILSHRAC